MLTSFTIFILTLEKIQASGRGMAVLGHFPCCLASGHWKGLPIYAAFLCRWLFTGMSGCFSNPKKEVLCRVASGHGSGPCGLEGWGFRMHPSPRSIFPLERAHWGRPSTRNTSAPSPGTTHAQPACGIRGCLNFPGSGRTIWMGQFCVFSNLTDEFSKTCKWVQEILTYLLPF